MPKLVLIGLMILSLNACEQEQKPLAIAGGKWIGYQPFFVMFQQEQTTMPTVIQQKLWARIQLTQFPSQTPILRLMLNDQLDGALVTLDEALIMQNKSLSPLCVAAIVDYSNGADALVVNPTRFYQADSARVIGYEPAPMSQFFLRRALDKLELSEAEVETRNLRPDQQISAYQAGEVDALLTYEPYLTRLLRLGAREIFSSKETPNEIVDVLIVHEQVWKTHRDDINQLLDAVQTEGLHAIRQGHPDILEQITFNTGLSQEEINNAFDKLNFPTRQESLHLLEEQLPITISRLEQLLLAQQLITQPTQLSGCR